MEMNSVWGILVLEGFIALVLLVIVFLIINKNKKANEHEAAHELIDRLEDSKNSKAKKLGQIILDHCKIEQGVLNKLLGEINQNEQQLYKQILTVFLNRDVTLLEGLDEHVERLSEPYIKILGYTGFNAELEIQEKQNGNEIKKLKRANKQLEKQLAEAMATMDEISEEYTRVFSGTQTELELENSRKKMFAVFKYAESRVKATLNPSKNNVD